MSKKTLIIVGFIVLFFAFPGFAQGGEAYGRRNFPISDSPCWTKPYLEATPEQLKALEDLQRSFYKEIASLRNQQVNLRYELRCMLTNPKVEAKMVLSKQSILSAIQKKLDEISIQYLLKARAIFTPEQLSRLPTDCALGFNYGPGKGWGRGMRQR